MSNTSQNTPPLAGDIPALLKKIADELERQGHYKPDVDPPSALNSLYGGKCCLVANPTLTMLRRSDLKMTWAVEDEMKRRIRIRGLDDADLVRYSDHTPTAEVLEMLRADV